LYLALTDASNARTLIASRGPGFKMPDSSGFVPLGSSPEPTARVLADIVEAHYDNLEIISMGNSDASVAFAGLGEPTLRLDVLLETVKIHKQYVSGDGASAMRFRKRN